MAANTEITKDTIIADFLSKHPECIEVFDRHEMPCRTCAGAMTGTIAEGAMMHDVDADAIVEELKACCAPASRHAELDSVPSHRGVPIEEVTDSQYP